MVKFTMLCLSLSQSVSSNHPLFPFVVITLAVIRDRDASDVTQGDKARRDICPCLSMHLYKIRLLSNASLFTVPSSPT
jgi:hypothetical protein